MEVLYSVLNGNRYLTSVSTLPVDVKMESGCISMISEVLSHRVPVLKTIIV